MREWCKFLGVFIESGRLGGIWELSLFSWGSHWANMCGRGNGFG